MFIFGSHIEFSAITDLLSDGSEYQADVSETDDELSSSKSESRSRYNKVLKGTHF